MKIPLKLERLLLLELPRMRNRDVTPKWNWISPMYAKVSYAGIRWAVSTVILFTQLSAQPNFFLVYRTQPRMKCSMYYLVRIKKKRRSTSGRRSLSWNGNQWPFKDNKHHVLGFSLIIGSSVGFNTSSWKQKKEFQTRRSMYAAVFELYIYLFPTGRVLRSNVFSRIYECPTCVEEWMTPFACGTEVYRHRICVFFSSGGKR